MLPLAAYSGDGEIHLCKTPVRTEGLDNIVERKRVSSAYEPIVQMDNSGKGLSTHILILCSDRWVK